MCVFISMCVCVCVLSVCVGMSEWVAEAGFFFVVYFVIVKPL